MNAGLTFAREEESGDGLAPLSPQARETLANPLGIVATRRSAVRLVESEE
jgi:hypothetical protein